jgi:muramoyltetrapeptide carboxypeptidase
VGGKPVGDNGKVQATDVLPDDIMEACFDDLITGQGEGAGWRQNRRLHQKQLNR